ncbi:MAG: hypothetical protein U9R34_01075 [Nanoarchaeota archaeon]|nr:hypothetical protein [Nanoarchaeota archaeon]
MQKTSLVTISLVVIILILSTYLYLQPAEPSAVLDEPSFSQVANDWIEPLEEKENFEINISEATEARADYSLGHQRYIDYDGSINSFYLTGSYMGKLFSMTYQDANDRILMRIYSDMKPSDGVSEGFILVKREEGELAAYMFVDEDWKIKSKNNINIIYGENIQDKESLISRRFDFSNNQEGVYIDKLKGNLNWLTEQNPILGRLFLGEISLDDILRSDYNQTFIVLT